MKKSAVVAVMLAISFLIGTLTGCSVFDSYDPLKNSENIALMVSKQIRNIAMRTSKNL